MGTAAACPKAEAQAKMSAAITKIELQGLGGDTKSPEKERLVVQLEDHIIIHTF